MKTTETITLTLDQLFELVKLGWSASCEGCNAEYHRYSDETIHMQLREAMNEHLFNGGHFES